MGLDSIGRRTTTFRTFLPAVAAALSSGEISSSMTEAVTRSSIANCVSVSGSRTLSALAAA